MMPGVAVGGNDTITGGAGADAFVFDNASGQDARAGPVSLDYIYPDAAELSCRHA